MLSSPLSFIAIDWKDYDAVDKRISEELKPILEEWIGGEIPLNYSQHYGVRRYFNGVKMHLHVDRPITHVVSAILQIDQVIFCFLNLLLFMIKSRQTY